MELQTLLFSLSRACGVTSGAAQAALEAVRPYSPAARLDRLGSVVAPVRAPREGEPHVMLEAHIDEIGFAVTAVDADGFLRLGKIGGPDVRVLLGAEVTVHAKQELFGVFCCRPPHLSSAEDYKKVPELKEMAVDIGFGHDEACKRVMPGDLVTLRAEPAEMENGFVTGKALDNRAGVAVVLRCLELCAQDVSCGLTAVFSTGEELGMRGAVPAAYSVSPTHAIVTDVSFGMTPDAPREHCGEMGEGPMIGVSPTLSRSVTELLFRLAEEKKIPHQREVMAGGTGTNADAISVSRAGVATGLLSVPLRYMHTAAECIKPSDVENTARLMAEAVRAIGGGCDA